jgi:hypothetical protein
MSSCSKKNASEKNAGNPNLGMTSFAKKLKNSFSHRKSA